MRIHQGRTIMAQVLQKTGPMSTGFNPRGEKGFTLTELMIVVVILGILAAIAIISFRKYAQYSKTSEVYTVLGDIRAKQEGYRAEFSQYCPVQGQNLSGGTPYPAGAPDPDGKTQWGTPPVNWQQLGFSVHGPVYAGYVVAAGLPGQACTGCPAGMTGDHWWAAWGLLDLDGDGNRLTFEAINMTTDVFSMDHTGTRSEYE
jgi:type IV pilus assembly protein PilA